MEINSTERKQIILTNVYAEMFKGLISFCNYKANPWKLRYSCVFFFFFFFFHFWITKQQFICSEIQHVMMTLGAVLHSESGGPVFIFQFPYFLHDVLFGL